MRRAGKFLDTDDSVMLSNWMKMVEDYSSRGLSRPSDRLLPLQQLQKISYILWGGTVEIGYYFNTAPVA